MCGYVIIKELNVMSSCHINHIIEAFEVLKVTFQRQSSVFFWYDEAQWRGC